MKKNKTIIATILLIIIIGTAIAATSKSYYNLEKKVCFNTLKEYTNQLAYEIKINVYNDREQLKLISNIIDNYDSIHSQEVVEILSSYSGQGMMSHLEILLPDDTILKSDGQVANAIGFSFQEEAVKGAHMSARMIDPVDGKKILHSYVPIVKNHETVAILYGVIDLEALPQLFSVDAFDHNTQIYLIEGTNGDFLLDTWHKNLENVDNFFERQTKKGYHIEKVSSDFRKGQSGSIVVFSENAKKYFYSHYAPVGIDQWMVMLSVPEDIAFQRVYHIMRLSYYLAAFVIVTFVIYLVWIIVSVRKENYEIENQLNRVQYMFEVEKILFNAYMEPEYIEKALAKIGEVLTAQTTFLFLVKKQIITKQFIWDGSKQSGDQALTNEKIQAITKDVWNTLILGQSILEYDLNKFYKMYHIDKALTKPYAAQNMMIVPVMGLNGELTGIIGAYNMKHHWQNAAQLECVTLSFAMAINNMDVYLTIKKMGTIDSLTGLFNRNSYLAALEDTDLQNVHSLACVYIDVNGLHELNNHLGHEAGDIMLRWVADEIKNTFAKDKAYRIGGDEFVVFCFNQTKKEIQNKANTVKQTAKDKKYHLSIGVEWQGSDLDRQKMIKGAEERMLQDKRKYYREKGDERKIREMNRHLEKMISDKQDADAFLSVIAENFKGVYFVNLTSDSVRHIYIPNYFEELLAQTDGAFSKAIAMYADLYVSKKDIREFKQFCQYQLLEERLQEEKAIPELIYQKKEGKRLKLKVFKFKKYSDAAKETLWVFEEARI